MIEKEIFSSEKLYYKDSKIKEFDAVVLSCEKVEDYFEVVLDKTAFFPEGGGQYGDKGNIGEAIVFDTFERDGKIIHKTDKDLVAGEKVLCKLDWDLRFDKMQQHSAEHIVSGLVCKTYGYNNVGFHLGDEITTLDFDGALSYEQVKGIEFKANMAVAENISIRAFIPSKDEEKLLDYRSKIDIEGEIRLVEIPGYDLCACCAPHVYKTGEIGLIKIVNYENYKGGTRLTMLAGFRALRDYDEKLNDIKTISNLLSVKADFVDVAVDKLYIENQNLKFEIIKLQEELLMSEIDDIINDSTGGVAIKISGPLDMNVARRFVNSLVDRGVRVGAIFVEKSDNEYQYIFGSKTLNLKDFAPIINESLDGRGGGKPEMISGTAICSEEVIKEKIEKIFA